MPEDPRDDLHEEIEVPFTPLDVRDIPKGDEAVTVDWGIFQTGGSEMEVLQTAVAVDTDIGVGISGVATVEECGDGVVVAVEVADLARDDTADVLVVGEHAVVAVGQAGTLGEQRRKRASLESRFVGTEQLLCRGVGLPDHFPVECQHRVGDVVDELRGRHLIEYSVGISISFALGLTDDTARRGR